jgi:hypothetical protein
VVDLAELADRPMTDPRPVSARPRDNFVVIDEGLFVSWAEEHLQVELHPFQRAYLVALARGRMTHPVPMTDPVRGAGTGEPLGILQHRWAGVTVVADPPPAPERAALALSVARCFGLPPRLLGYAPTGRPLRSWPPRVDLRAYGRRRRARARRGRRRHPR